MEFDFEKMKQEREEYNNREIIRKQNEILDHLYHEINVANSTGINTIDYYGHMKHYTFGFTKKAAKSYAKILEDKGFKVKVKYYFRHFTWRVYYLHIEW